MNKFLEKIKLPLFLLLTATSCLAIFIGISRAADQVITCDSSGCSSPGTALFTVDNAVPGESFKKTFEIKNLRGENLSVSLTASKSAGTDDLILEKIDVKIDESGGGNKYTGTLDSLLNLGTSVPLGIISPSSSKEYEFTLSLQDVGNDYQGKRANFDLSVSVTGEAVTEGGGTPSVLGAADSGIVGKVLGLAATGSGLLSKAVLWLGIIGLVFGAKFLAESYKKSKKART